MPQDTDLNIESHFETEDAEDLLDLLSERKEYKIFRRKTVGVCLFFSVSFLVMFCSLFAGEPSESISFHILMVVGLAIGVVVSMRTAFFITPDVSIGIVEEVREYDASNQNVISISPKTLTTARKIRHEYLVYDGQGSVWARCAASHTKRRELQYLEDEEVLLFSIGGGRKYVAKYEPKLQAEV